jgi:hypothetical protein
MSTTLGLRALGLRELVLRGVEIAALRRVRRARVEGVEARQPLRRESRRRYLVGLSDVVDDRPAVDRERVEGLARNALGACARQPPSGRLAPCRSCSSHRRSFGDWPRR